MSLGVDAESYFVWAWRLGLAQGSRTIRDPRYEVVSKRRLIDERENFNLDRPIYQAYSAAEIVSMWGIVHQKLKCSTKEKLKDYRLSLASGGNLSITYTHRVSNMIIAAIESEIIKPKDLKL